MKNDLLENCNNYVKKFGNVRFFFKGRMIFNSKMVGLYFTIILLLSNLYAICNYM